MDLSQFLITTVHSNGVVISCVSSWEQEQGESQVISISPSQNRALISLDLSHIQKQLCILIASTHPVCKFGSSSRIK
jgi:hypothetical protein